MPIHEYRCDVCHRRVEEYRSIEEGGERRRPECCGLTMWRNQNVQAMDAFEPGGEFITYDGQNHPVKVESFAQMHKLEKESEQQYRNGEGQPIRFRMLHNHRNNREVNTFGADPSEKPTAEAAKRFGGSQRAVAAGESGAPDVAFGPGVNESNASALGGT